jgi:hypothetical protein
MKHLGEDLDACIAGRRPAALAMPWTDLVDRVKAKPALASIPAAAVLLLGLAVHAAVTEPAAPTEAAPETITAIDNADEKFEIFEEGVLGITKHYAGDKQGSKAKPESRSESDDGWHNALPKKALVVLSNENYDQNDLDTTLNQLRKYEFETTIATNQKGKLHSRGYEFGKNGHVHIKQPLAEVNAQDYISVVLLTGDSTHEFNAGTPVGRQLQQQLKKTLQMHGLIVGVGTARGIVADESLSGPVHYEECDGLWIGAPTRGSGTVIKVESKHIPPMAWKLSERFAEVKKKHGNK